MIHIVTPNYKAPDNSIVINTTSRSSDWGRSLSPFLLGPVNLYDGYTSLNVENGWQYSKVYEYFLNEDDEVGERYFNWAKEGWSNPKANRYPMGKNIKPLYSYWNGKKLSYTEARREIYIPLYSKAVKNTHAFSKLQEIYRDNQDIYLVDFDAHNLNPETLDYWKLIDNANIKVGHAYVLAMMLENII